MSITLIWAMSKNRVIGRNNELPWRLPADLKYFKEQTTGKTIVMGRKTWESIGSKPLPNRRNIVVTRDPDYTPEGAEVMHTVEAVLALSRNEELWIIGGAAIFADLLPYADTLVMTLIDEDIEGDTYFPETDWSTFELVSDTLGVRDEKNPYDYRFLVYERRT